MTQDPNLIIETMQGKILRFTADRPQEVIQALSAMQPEHFFEQPQLFFFHDDFLAGIPTSQVAYIQFAFPCPVPWTYDLGFESAELISPRQFEEQRQIKQVQTRILLQTAALGTPLHLIQRLNLVSGTELHFRLSVKTIPTLLRLMNLEKTLRLKTFFAQMEEGMILVNAAAMHYWHAFPGPLAPPAGAFHISAEHTS